MTVIGCCFYTMKAKTAREVGKFQDIPNVGAAITRDFLLLGIQKPSDLKQCDAFSLYKKMCRVSGVRQDPCVLDTYMAVIDFMNGAPLRPWWFYTKARKRAHPDL
jgi:hypothetical protein